MEAVVSSNPLARGPVALALDATTPGTTAPVEYAVAVDQYLGQAAIGTASRRVYRISLAGTGRWPASRALAARAARARRRRPFRWHCWHCLTTQGPVAGWPARSRNGAPAPTRAPLTSAAPRAGEALARAAWDRGEHDV